MKINAEAYFPHMYEACCCQPQIGIFRVLTVFLSLFGSPDKNDRWSRCRFRLAGCRSGCDRLVSKVYVLPRKAERSSCVVNALRKFDMNFLSAMFWVLVLQKEETGTRTSANAMESKLRGHRSNSKENSQCGVYE